MKKIFTIGTRTIPGEVILPHLMPRILQQNPDISLKLVITNSWTPFESVRKGEIEVGIIGTHYAPTEIEYQTVIENDRLVLIAPKEDPLVKKAPLSIEDLRGKPFVNRESGSRTRATFEKAFQLAGLPLDDLNIVAEISDTEGVIQAVQAGTGFSVVSEGVHSSFVAKFPHPQPLHLGTMPWRRPKIGEGRKRKLGRFSASRCRKSPRISSLLPFPREGAGGWALCPQT